MSNPYYPPGHPTGTGDCDVEIECDVCGHVWLVPGIVEYDTNAAYPVDESAPCPKCAEGKPDAEEDVDDE